jgi:hypothetical protein
MKIGIVTFWRSEDNYGQQLQCYALQTFLKQQGHDAFLIKDIPCRKKMSQKIIHLYSNFSIKQVFFSLRYIWYNWLSNRINKRHDRNFTKFREQHIVSTEKEYTFEMLKENPPLADIYICGSDQIWNAKDISPIYFLNFGDKNVKRISYAPSFGSIKNAGNYYFKQISKWLEHFDVITVREQCGIEICKKAGREDAVCVIDPTLLLSKLDYMQLAEPVNTQNKKYLLLYLLGNNTCINIATIYEFAKKEGLEVVYVASQGRVDKYLKTYPNIGQWLFLINNAEYVITNSYHGAIFSIIMNRQFLVLPLKGKQSEMNERLFTLLNNYKMNDRLYSSNIAEITKNINYTNLNLKINDDRNCVKNRMKTWFEK